MAPRWRWIAPGACSHSLPWRVIGVRGASRSPALSRPLMRGRKAATVPGMACDPVVGVWLPVCKAARRGRVVRSPRRVCSPACAHCSRCVSGAPVPVSLNPRRAVPAHGCNGAGVWLSCSPGLPLPVCFRLSRSPCRAYSCGRVLPVWRVVGSPRRVCSRCGLYGGHSLPALTHARGTARGVTVPGACLPLIIFMSFCGA